jgi:hypothetical protein
MASDARYMSPPPLGFSQSSRIAESELRCRESGPRAKDRCPRRYRS